MYPRYAIPPLVVIELAFALRALVRRLLRHKTRSPCHNCGMLYCNGRTCRQLAEQRRRAVDLLKPWAETVEEATREFV